MKWTLSVASILFYLNGNSQAKPYDFPNPVNTEDKEITTQVRKTYQVGDNLFIDNQFDGARLNGLTVLNDSSVIIQINPENSPINTSPWYAFKLWSTRKINTTVTIEYQDNYKHRYWPKVSSDKNEWVKLDSGNVQVAPDTLSVQFSLTVTKDTTWVSAQPLETSSKVQKWCTEISSGKNSTFSSIGKSRGQRDLFHVKLGTGNKTVVLLSRQHPPEVTGYYALKSFVSKIIDRSKLSKKFLETHTVLIYPLLNPDGVDEGHWRHNLGGVDLNRDWAYYNQKEIRQIADHIVAYVTENQSEVVLGLDFHSTYYDVYYTTARSVETINKSFTDDWLNYIGSNLEGYEINDQPSGIGGPVSKGWFITQFNAPGITFEIGDNTPTEFIDKKGKVAAEGMMKVLLDLN